MPYAAARQATGGHGHASPGGRRLVEWTALACVVLVLVGLLAQRVQQVRTDMELAAIKATLGGLRTAFIIHHLQQSAGGVPHAVASTQRNPFELVSPRPVNYLGEVDAGQVAGVAPGQWFYEPACSCIGYLPLYPDVLTSASGKTVLWLTVSASPGPFQLTLKEDYFWQGDVLN